MNGYLNFLKSLSQSQQRAEIGRIAFIQNHISSSSLEEDLLKTPTVVALSETLSVDPSSWTLELKHYAEELDVIGTPVFDTGQCRAPFRFRYEQLDRNQNLVVTGMIYIDDDQSALIGTVEASSTQEESSARERLVELGIDPDTMETLKHDREMATKMPYLEYLERLLPQQQRDAIFDLADRVFGANPGGLDGNRPL